jgi:hypothetical protein
VRVSAELWCVGSVAWPASDVGAGLPSSGRPVTLMSGQAGVTVHRGGARSHVDRERRRRSGRGPRGPWTERARREACRRVGKMVTAWLRSPPTAPLGNGVYGVGWLTVMAAVREHGTPLVEDPAWLVGWRRWGD